jgi:hypothetical protein
MMGEIIERVPLEQFRDSIEGALQILTVRSRSFLLHGASTTTATAPA